MGEYYRGVRASALGNAMTALSDDADAVFYNPAGLALNQHFQFRVFNPKIDISADDINLYPTLQKLASKIDSATVGGVFGKHIYANGSIFPAVYFPYFMLGFLGQVTTKMYARNLSMPTIEATYLKDMGVVGAFALETRGFSRRHFMRFGLGLKMLTREGFDRDLSVVELLAADKSYVKTLMGGPAVGWSGSLGFQYEIMLSKHSDFIMGSAWQDVGDTFFGDYRTAKIPPPIRNNLSIGSAYIYHFGNAQHSNSDLKISGDLRHLLQNGVDPRLKTHLGVELKISDLSLQVGWNQDSYTAGAKLDMFFFEASAATYSVENQALAFYDRERRYMVQFTFKLDPMGKMSRNAKSEEIRKRPRSF